MENYKFLTIIRITTKIKWKVNIFNKTNCTNYVMTRQLFEIKTSHLVFVNVILKMMINVASIFFVIYFAETFSVNRQDRK